MYSTDIGPVIFNEANLSFEALVTFKEGRDITRIPTSLRFPVDAPPSTVAMALIRQAKEKRRRFREPFVTMSRA